MDGKAMIVCMSRRICVDLCREIIALRPAWHSGDDAQGILKVVTTGSASDTLDCHATSVTQHDARISRSGSTA
jgi:type I restriction enzyme R subunit